MHTYMHIQNETRNAGSMFVGKLNIMDLIPKFTTNIFHGHYTCVIDVYTILLIITLFFSSKRVHVHVLFTIITYRPMNLTWSCDVFTNVNAHLSDPKIQTTLLNTRGGGGLFV